MNHKIVSFYKHGLNLEILKAQKNVFDKFKIPLLQVEFKNTHHDAIENFLRNNKFDVISIIDIDFIPLKKDVFEVANNIVTSSNVVYGNAQSSNSFAYVAPSFLNFSNSTYNIINCSSFVGGIYRDKEIDVAELFSIKAREKNISLQFSLPINVIQPLWKCKVGSPQFEFGVGTFYDNNTFHCFEIRKQERQQIFLNECKKVLES